MYFLILIQNTGDGTAQTITAFNDIEGAKAAYHNELAYAMTAKTLVWDFVEVIDSDGNVLAQEKWVNPAR